MSNEQKENNRVYIKGRIVSGFSYSHEVHGERFYMADICTCRNSGYKDIIPLIVSEQQVDVGHDYSRRMAAVTGQLHSCYPRETDWRRLVLSVFVRKIEFWAGELEDNRNDNRISLEGFLCKEPVYRKTPLGREIADIFLAVSRSCGKMDYIPCIVWGRNAELAVRFKMGTAVNIQGRIQSREYVKWLSEEKAETRVAYEVSVSRLRMIGSAEKRL